MCSKAQAPPKRAGPGRLPSLLSVEQSRNRLLSGAAGGTSERSAALSALARAVKSSKGGLCALSAGAFGWERSEEGNRERAVKGQFLPLFLLAQQPRAGSAGSAHTDRSGLILPGCRRDVLRAELAAHFCPTQREHSLTLLNCKPGPT